MGLKLNLSSPRAYVQAVSGLFISPNHPNGLTSKEMNVLSCLIEYSTHGIVTQEAREKSIDKLKFTKQNFYNAMSTLKSKQAIKGESLHSIFTSDNLMLSYANN